MWGHVSECLTGQSDSSVYKRTVRRRPVGALQHHPNLVVRHDLAVHVLGEDCPPLLDQLQCLVCGRDLCCLLAEATEAEAYQPSIESDPVDSPFAPTPTKADSNDRVGFPAFEATASSVRQICTN
jgi:hypothetical protein